MCSLVAHDRLQENEQDDESSLGDRVISKVATEKALNSLGSTFILLTYGYTIFIKIILNGVCLIQLQWLRCSLLQSRECWLV